MRRGDVKGGESRETMEEQRRRVGQPDLHVAGLPVRTGVAPALKTSVAETCR
jgi:hypothetical protein